ncbi:MAG: C1 family peptidase [Luteimonas sp.]|nr:C1 family peptidase [Luteimonas sp.]
MAIARNTLRSSRSGQAITARLLDARPDTADFRDRMFTPTLIDVPTSWPLSHHTRLAVPILDQGDEGACTAFGLATVAHTLLRTRISGANRTRVSTRMFYDMARRYDEWRGESYSGSSCRGAMKGWHHHGVCSEETWPYTPGREGALEPYTEARARDATRRPLGAYFRVNHKDLVAMHAAFAEVRVLYASCGVHEGWIEPPAHGRIAWRQQEELGYHAFAIVAYDDRGFWIQNSWGRSWGHKGYGYISYDEWLERGTDVWVARLAVPVRLQGAQATAVSHSALARQATGYSQADLRPHIVSLGNNGLLRDEGRFGTTREDVRNLLRKDLRATTRGWKKKRVLLFAHGGLVPEQTAIQRVADLREALLPQEIYPLCFIWKSDFWTTLGNLLRDATLRRSEGLLDRAKELLLDRLDDTLEPLARVMGGKAVWDEMKENALLATTAVERGLDGGLQEAGGAAQVARLLGEWMSEDPSVELHLVGHSAGSILLAPMLQLLTTRGQVAMGPARGMQGIGVDVASVNLWAPAITVDLFLQAYAPAIEARSVDRACLFTLSDKAENDDHCAGVYHKSLLYLIAHAFEAQARSWIDRRLRQGTPIVGMARFVEAKEVEDQALGYETLRKLVRDGRLGHVQSPTAGKPEGAADAANATSHGGFDDDRATIKATIARILGTRSAPVQFEIRRSEAGLEDRRRMLQRALFTEPLSRE